MDKGFPKGGGPTFGKNSQIISFFLFESVPKVFVEIIDGVLLTNSGQKSVLVWWMGWEFWLSNVRLLKLVSLLSFFCGYFLAISGLFGLHHNGLFTFGLSDWTTRTIGLSQFVLKRLLDYSNWTYGSSGLSKFGLHSK